MKRIEAASSFGAFSSRRDRGTFVRSGVPRGFGNRRLRLAAPRSIVSRARASQPNREEGSHHHRRAKTRPFLERRSRSTGGFAFSRRGAIQVVRDESSRTVETDTLVRSKRVKRDRPHVLREHPSITFPRNAFRYKRPASKSALEVPTTVRCHLPRFNTLIRNRVRLSKIANPKRLADPDAGIRNSNTSVFCLQSRVIAL